MAMRLLSAPEGKSRTQLDNAAQQLRSQELDVLIVAKRKEINDLDLQLTKTLTEKGAQNYEEELQWKQKLDVMRREVEELESRKRVALAPLAEKERILTLKEEELSQKEQFIGSKEEQLTYEQGIVAKRQKELEEREIWAENRRSELERKQLELTQAEIETETRLIELREESEVALEKEQDIRRKIATLESELIPLRDERTRLMVPIEVERRALSGKEQELVSRETTLIEQQHAIEKEKKSLESQLASLSREQDTLEARKLALVAEETQARLSHAKEQKVIDKGYVELERQQTLLRKEKETFQEKMDVLRTLKAEIEEQKKSLVPLELKEKELDTKSSVLLEREEQVLIRESELEHESELLEDKLDTFSEREQSATEYADRLTKREFTVSFQEKELQAKMDALTKIIQQSYEDVKKAQTEASTQKALLKGRDVTIAERERKVKEAEASFANREEAILDKYRTLQRTITEVNLTNDRNLSNP